jgi:hypothetical protein
MTGGPKAPEGRNHAEAVRAGKTGAWAGAGLSVLFVLFFQASKQLPALARSNPFAVDPYDAIGSVAIQVAMVVAGLTWVRTARYWGLSSVPLRQLRFMLRGLAVVVLSIALTLAGDASALLVARFSENPDGSPALIDALAALAVLTGITGWMLGRFAARYSRTAEASTGPTRGSDDDFFDDLRALVYRGLEWILRYFPRVLRVLLRLDQLLSWRPVATLRRVLDIRRYPWRFCTVVMIIAGAGLILFQGISEGLPANLAHALEASAILFSGEVLSGLIGFAILGRYLGLYRPELQQPYSV